MGQGFAHERLPEKGTVLLLDTYDLTEILKECQSYASVGYKIASSQHENLKTTLSNAASRINETLIDFNSSPCYVSSATDLLSQQLIDIESAFNNLSFAFKEDLENLRENLSKFSVTLFGRTMAGKSTLMEILTNGDGLSIGNGAQRTTRDVRQYNWNGLEITDVPGIGAFEGEDDEQIAFEAAKKADLILFLITDDAPQAAEAECFGRIMDLGKPVICIMNVKASAPEGKSIKLLTRDIEKRFDMERLNEIRKQFMSYSKQLGQDWGYVPFVYVHLKSAFMSQNTEDPQVKDTLHKVSRIGFLKKKIVEQVRERGCFYRVKTFIDIITNPMLVSMENLLNQSLLNSAQGRIVLASTFSCLQFCLNIHQQIDLGWLRLHGGFLAGRVLLFSSQHRTDFCFAVPGSQLVIHTGYILPAGSFKADCFPAPRYLAAHLGKQLQKCVKVCWLLLQRPVNHHP